MGVRILHTFTDVCKEYFYDKRDDFNADATFFQWQRASLTHVRKSPFFTGILEDMEYIER